MTITTQKNERIIVEVLNMMHGLGCQKVPIALQ